ncbi:hypothetical protein AX17_002781 [Amanita inopinata Kibby_2008]|nr:hypothetical protein AX17_002781 [Amanita inopinata Kibby_2008]
MFGTRRRSMRRETNSSSGGGSSTANGSTTDTTLPDADAVPPVPPLPDTSSVDNGTHLSQSAFNQRSRELLELDRDLRDLGAQMFLDVPRISVIGSQSAGKSSLVEAVSGINVPRDSGTCTRCPMECSMAQASTWSCNITLRLQFDEDGDAYASLRSEAFGPVLTNRADVDIWLRRAQAAILCPHLPAENFYNKTKQDLEALRELDDQMHQFSRNTIHVNVKDPEVTGLSFIDLPGLIQNSEMPELIDLVRELVETNISGDNTLILIAIPMSDDMENQQAVRLAREADPSGERTIGVLTKPDVVLPTSIGQLQKWRDVLESRMHKLQHGYYCVRLPDEAERVNANARAESERLADNFFRTRAPWNEMQMRNRFGIPNLVRDISTLLVQWIEKNLPNLRLQLNKLLSECTDDINSLPPPLEGDANTELLLRVGEFSRAFRDAVFATEYKRLARQARERYLKYKTDILRTTPDFRPFENYKEYRRPELPSNDLDRLTTFNTSPMDLEYVRQVIKNSVGWELPGHVPFAATKTLVLRSTSLWLAPSLQCFEDVYSMTVDVINDLIHKHFDRFPKAEVYIRSLVNVELDEYKMNAIKQVQTLLELESQPLFTQNLHYFEAEQTKWHRHYSSIRNRESTYNAAYSDSGSVSVRGTPSDTAAFVKDDEYTNELILMSRVQAYFRVGYKRIIDHLPLTIEHSLNRALDSALELKLLAKLTSAPNFAQRVVELMGESPEITEKRRSLTERKERFLQIRNRLDEFGHF